jgi:hypothetical protein
MGQYEQPGNKERNNEMKKNDLKIALEMITEGRNANVADVMMTESVARHKAEKPWTSSKKIQGFGIGRRVTEGKRLGDIAIKVYVERKLPKAKLGKQMIPKKLTSRE